MHLDLLHLISTAFLLTILVLFVIVPIKIINWGVRTSAKSTKKTARVLARK